MWGSFGKRLNCIQNGRPAACVGSTRHIGCDNQTKRQLRRLIIERFETRQLLAADFEPLKIIETDTATSFPASLTPVGNQLFFTATTEYGNELWKSDGTVAGTTMVKDIAAGAQGSSPGNLTAVGNTLFFMAFTASTGYELWKSDGTSAGTVLVKNINPGAAHSSPSSLTNVNGTLFFSADDGISGPELWKSDGTTAGTVLVKDIRSGSSSSGILNLANLGGLLVFTANDGINGNELWKSDGTTAGTSMLAQINPGVGDSDPSSLTQVGNFLYFSANDGSLGVELWRTGGTAATTNVVANIGGGSISSDPSYLTNLNGQLLFAARDTEGVELWKSDGSSSGTQRVKDIFLGSFSSFPTHLANVAGVLYFSAIDANGRELWKSDGTNVGTNLVKDLWTGANSSDPSEFVPFNAKMIFTANDGNNRAIFVSDGTSAGTKLLKHTSPGSGFSPTGSPTPFAGAVFFVAPDPTFGVELWRTDGTDIGTLLFKDINNQYAGSNPNKLAEANGKVFFNAGSKELGRELWITDGTTQGTVLVKDINPGSGGSDISDSTLINGVLYFNANDGTSGSELWRSDGTTAGTFQIADIAAGTLPSLPFHLTNVNGLLYFSANDFINGVELWMSDGTAAGTKMVKDIRPGSASSSTSSFVNANGVLFFSANDGSNGVELWKSDGTSTGTVLVKDINLSGSGQPLNLAYVNGRVYFDANNGVSGDELWVSDGTGPGTFMLADIQPGAAGSVPFNFVGLGNMVFFSATSGSGNELWKTDGTPIGTVMVKDILIGSGSSFPDNFVVIGGTLYFSATDAFGSELWKTDGTTSGTARVKDINRVGGSGIFAMTNFGGQLVFTATAGSDTQAWTSDGTTVGTIPLVANTAATSIPALPHTYASVNGKLLAFGNEVLQLRHTIDIDLTSSNTNRSIVIRKNSLGIEVFDQTATLPLAQLANLTLTDIDQLFIHGSDFADESITVDFQSGGLFSFADGLDIEAGNSSGDALNVLGTTAQRLTWQTLESASSSAFAVRQQNTVSNNTLNGFETITTSGFLSAIANELLQAGPPNMFFNNPGTFALAETTQLGGGTLSTTSLASLAAGHLLTGTGSMSGRFIGEAGSLILPSGNLAIGLNSSPSGFSTRGDLVVDQYTVSLLDNNEAVLGSQTTLGNSSAPGVLSASNGLLVDFGNNVTGFGNIDTPNLSTKPFVMNGSVIGSSAANPIRLTGYVKGVGNLTNVNIAGTYSPGFSPAAVTVGSMTYTSTSTTVIELGGSSPGTGYDQINHLGNATLGGTLSVQLINTYVPSVGDNFTIMTATGGFTGSFATILLPTPTLGSGWDLAVGTNSIQLRLVDLAEVQSVQFGDGKAQHSQIDRLVVTFDGPVDVDTNAFSVIKRGLSGGAVTNSFVLSTTSSGDTVATLSFSGAFTRSDGFLVDGYYQLTIDSNLVRRKSTSAKLDGNYDGVAGGDFVRGTKSTDNFFAFYGDANGDGQVGIAEFGQFRTTFGKQPTDVGYDSIFDYDGGGIGVVDFGQFRSRFGHSLAFE